MSLPETHDAPAAAPFELDTTPLRDPAAIAARDRLWLEHVYDPNDPQLTVRAAIVGMLLGGTLGAANLYIGLKVGWSFGMSITASVVGFAVFGAIGRVFPSMRPLTRLENNTSQTAASAAGYMSSAGLVSSVPAMMMLREDGTISTPMMTPMQLSLWLLGISVLGVVVAIPLKRNLINAEQLRFPSGVVCAETIRTLHARGGEALAQARSLFASGLAAGAWKAAVESKLGPMRSFPEVIAFPGRLRGHALSAWSLGMNTSFLLYAAGAIVGMKVSTSLAVGALFDYGVLGPWLLDHGVFRVAPPDVAASAEAWTAFRKATEAAHAVPLKSVEALHAMLRAKWSVWPGTSIMVSASIVAFAFRWRMIARALSGLGSIFRKSRSSGDGAKDDVLAAVEVPTSWFVVGLVVCGAACVAMQRAWFDVPIAMGVVSVGAAFVLSVVAARATGETDVTPIGAMGKITQLLFGVLVPGNAAANLMTATVTAGAASHSADLLTEVKTGYLLGGAPRKQFWAQLLGVFAGAAACVPAYFLIAKPEKIGKELAAPAAVAWASVARLLKDGVGNLPSFAVWGIAIGAAVGVVIAVAEELLPKDAKRFVPSATGLGIAFVIDANDSFAMFTGAVAALAVSKLWPKLGERYTVSVASGVTAGEGLMGIAMVALRDVFHVLP